MIIVNRRKISPFSFVGQERFRNRTELGLTLRELGVAVALFVCLYARITITLNFGDLVL